MMPRHPTIVMLIGWLLSAVLVAQAAAQVDPEHLASLEQDAIEAFYEGDFETAERLLRAQSEADPRSPVPHYNLACVLAARDRLEDALASLKKSVELGFADRRQIEHDPHLARLHGTPAFDAMIERWDEVLEARAQAALEASRDAFGPKYSYERDEAHRLLHVSSYTPESAADARLELERVDEWAQKHLFSLVELPADAPPAAWVTVIMPTPSHFRTWAVRHFGARAIQSTTQVGGLYDHDAKELWAQDLGGTLRHEFFHVLHWRNMDALGQRHPLWIQEGLASLVETVNPQGQPIPCWRTNLIRRHARSGSLLPVTSLMGDTGVRIHRDQALRFYAQTRAVGLFLLERGLLGTFYAHYTGQYRDDPTGLSSLLAVTGLEDADAFDDALRAWALGLPEVRQELGPGDAALGIRIDVATTGEGMRITGFPGRRPEGLRLGDIITHVDGQPTRDYFELVRVVSSHTPGDEVEVRFRRRHAHHKAMVTLQQVR